VGLKACDGVGSEVTATDHLVLTSAAQHQAFSSPYSLCTREFEGYVLHASGHELRGRHCVLFTMGGKIEAYIDVCK